MLSALLNWLAVRSPVVKAQEAELLQRDRKIDALERDLFLEKQRRCDLQADVAWLQTEIQKIDLPLGAIRKAIASTYPSPYLAEETIRVDYPLDLALALVLPIPLLAQKIAEAMMVAAVAALAKRFQMSDGVLGVLYPASSKAGGQ